jgi:hypothetical protein
MTAYAHESVTTRLESDGDSLPLSYASIAPHRCDNAGRLGARSSTSTSRRRSPLRAGESQRQPDRARAGALTMATRRPRRRQRSISSLACEVGVAARVASTSAARRWPSTRSRSCASSTTSWARTRRSFITPPARTTPPVTPGRSSRSRPGSTPYGGRSAAPPSDDRLGHPEAVVRVVSCLRDPLAGEVGRPVATPDVATTSLHQRLPNLREHPRLLGT